jgi:hypothetical protein
MSLTKLAMKNAKKKGKKNSRKFTQFFSNQTKIKQMHYFFMENLRHNPGQKGKFFFFLHPSLCSAQIVRENLRVAVETLRDVIVTKSNNNNNKSIIHDPNNNNNNKYEKLCHAYFTFATCEENFFLIF